MKYLLLLLAMAATTVSFAQVRFAASAGAASAKSTYAAHDFGKTISYYVAGHVEGKFNEPTGFEGYVQLANYRYDVSAFKAIDLGFMFKYYPASKFYLAPGFALNKIINQRYDGHTVNIADKSIDPYYTLGLGYEFTDHLIGAARYNGSIDGAFNYILNLGVKYRL